MSGLDLKIGIVPMGVEYQAYATTAQLYTPHCNAITFLNQGTSVVNIDNMVILQPGQSFGISGNAGEVIDYAFNITFTAPGVNSLIVVCKVFK